MSKSLRKAAGQDVSAIRSLLEQSAFELQRDTYSRAQIEAAMGPVFGVDQQMIQDSTYFVVENQDGILGCGGWSFREALFGGRSADDSEPRCLDPSTEPARVRAFFVSPRHARQGIGSMIMQMCETEIVNHGFHTAEISATLVGEPLHVSFGFTTTGYYEIELEGAAPMKVARMTKTYKTGEQGGTVQALTTE